MANRRMFSLDVVDTDRFLDMPISAQCLYFHFGMHADDDGFISSPKKIVKAVNCSNDDLKILISKEYIIPFDDGVVVITDWKANNYIQKDRYKETRYVEDKRLLTEKNGQYILALGSVPDTVCIQDVSSLETQVRLGKDRLGKDRLEREGETTPPPPLQCNTDVTPKKKKASQRFTPPTVDEVKAYCTERGNGVDAQRFVDFYTSKGWLVGKNKMKDWKAAVRTWEQRDKKEVAANDSIVEVDPWAEYNAAYGQWYNTSES